MRIILYTFFFISVGVSASADVIGDYKKLPSFIACTVKYKTLYPVLRIMYLSRIQLEDGGSQPFYESIPKKLNNSGGSTHFFIGLDSGGKRIELHSPTDVKAYPDCKIGTTVEELEKKGQVGRFELQ